MAAASVLLACLLACSLLGIDGKDSNSIATKTLLMQPDCHGNCKGYDACVIYDIDDDNPCDDADDSKDSDDSSQKSSKCQKTDKDSDYQYQCFNMLKKGGKFVGASFVVIFGKSADDVDDNKAHLDDKYLDTVDLHFNKTVTSWMLCGNHCYVDERKDKAAQVKISNESLSFPERVDKVMFNNIDFSEDMPSFYHLNSSIKEIEMKNCRVHEVPDVSEMEDLETLTLSGNYIKKYPAKMALHSLKNLDLHDNELESLEGEFTNMQYLYLNNNSLKRIPETIADMPILEELYLGYNTFTDLTVSPELYEIINRTVFDHRSEEIQTDMLDCPDGEIHNVGFTSLQVCVSEKAGVSQDGSNSSSSSSSSSETTEATEVTAEGGMSSSTVVYIAVPIVVVIFITAALLFFYLKRRKRAKSLDTRSWGYADASSPTLAATEERKVEGDNSIWSDQQLINFQLNVHDIQDIRKIGGGAFGVVYLVQYHSKFYASKRMREERKDANDIQRFISEIKLVAALEHPNVVKLVGAAWTKRSDFQALFEYMENGDLRSYLQGSSSNREWSDEKLHIANDIIQALVYVHSFSPPLLHRDLKSLNVLLDESFVAKLSDFGTARKHELNTMTVDGVGTVRWMAPEILRGEGHYTQACDIYSFGVILTELSTHMLPYYDLVRDDKREGSMLSLATRVSTGSVRPSLSGSCPTSIRSLAERCLSSNPDDRPTAAQIQYYFQKMLKIGSSSGSMSFE